MGAMSSRFTSLQQVVNQMPMATCTAMLEAVEAGNIITGAYSSRGGKGACPMLAALRHGAPPYYVPFAEVWDRYTGVAPSSPGKRSAIRYASHREQGVLMRLLKNRIFPDSEQITEEVTCDGCRRAEKIDYYGACVFCGHTLVVAPTPEPAYRVECGVETTHHLAESVAY